MRRQPPPRPGFFFEPLWAVRSTMNARPPTLPADMDPAEAAKLRQEFEDTQKNAPWTVWGSSLWVHGDALEVEGDLGEMRRGGGPLARLSVPRGDNPASPTNEHLAKRIAECVNALTGVVSPAATLDEARRLLARIESDESYEYADQAGRLLARLGKPVSPGE